MYLSIQVLQPYGGICEAMFIFHTSETENSRELLCNACECIFEIWRGDVCPSPVVLDELLCSVVDTM